MVQDVNSSTRNLVNGRHEEKPEKVRGKNG